MFTSKAGEMLWKVIRVSFADLVDDAFAVVRLPASPTAVVRQLAVRSILLHPAAHISLGVANSDTVMLATHLTRMRARIHR